MDVLTWGNSTLEIENRSTKNLAPVNLKSSDTPNWALTLETSNKILKNFYIDFEVHIQELLQQDMQLEDNPNFDLIIATQSHTIEFWCWNFEGHFQFGCLTSIIATIIIPRRTRWVLDMWCFHHGRDKKSTHWMMPLHS